VLRALALWVALLFPQPQQGPEPFHSSIGPVPAPVRADLKHSGVYQSNCPVALSALRVLTVTFRGFDGRAHKGELIVNQSAARPLAHVFHRLYRDRFPIRHMTLEEVYGRARPPDNDVSGSFDCRQAVPSPCTGGKGTGSWSMHAYGLAVDLNPSENPYVGCGQSHDPRTVSYMDRSRHRRGMITPKVLAAFRSVGWGWGGSWPGATHDYMHFSATGH
jgi:D-alanyl-D-alanine carboxypeptidase